MNRSGTDSKSGTTLTQAGSADVHSAGARRKFVGKPKPAPFDIDDTGEVYRLLSECWGYLRTCHHKHGTDWEGRQFAMDALEELQSRDFKLIPDPA